MKSFEEHIENLKKDYSYKLSSISGKEPIFFDEEFKRPTNRYAIALMIYEMLKFELEDKELLLNMEKELRGKNEKNL